MHALVHPSCLPLVFRGCWLIPRRLLVGVIHHHGEEEGREPREGVRVGLPQVCISGFWTSMEYGVTKKVGLA
jgi:hypothetical protein